jgi:NADH dehydrogenase (ubiquinone) 1 alpha subcomplex subunit 1
MCFEILPGLCLMDVCMAIAGVATACIHKFTSGSKNCQLFISVNLMERNRCICGVNRYYVSKGLDNTDYRSSFLVDETVTQLWSLPLLGSYIVYYSMQCITYCLIKIK